MDSGKKNLLEKFLNNELRGSELEKFLRMKENDIELSNLAKLHQEVDLILGDKDLTDFEHFLKGSRRNGSFRLYNLKKTWLVAAGIFLAFCSGLLLWTLNLSSPEELYETYYNRFPNITAYRGDLLPSDGLYHYSKGDFSEAVDLLKNAEDPDGLLSFYLGISYMELSKFNNALSTFDLSYERLPSEHPIRREIAWYRSLCYLRIDKEDEAIRSFKYLSQTEGPHQDEAARILENL